MEEKKKTFRLRFLLILIGVLLVGIAANLLFLPGPGGGSADVSSPETRTLIAIGDAQFAPFTFLENGEPRGFNVDLLKELARLKHLDIDIRLSDWSSAMQAVQDGKADILLGVADLEERRASLSFSERMLSMKSSLFVDNETYAYVRIEDLVGTAPIGVEKSDVAAQFLGMTYPGVELREFPDHKAAMEALADHEIEAAVLDYYSGLLSLQRLGLRSRIKVIGDPVLEKGYCLGVKKGNEALLIPLNDGLEILKSNGTIRRLQDRWLGTSVLPDFNWQYILYGLIALLGAAIFLLAWNIALRRAVHQRTSQLALSDELFRLYLEYSPIYMFFKDENLKSLKLSRNYEKMLGRPLGELLHKSTRDLFPGDLARSIEEADFRILREGKPVEVIEELNGRIYTTIKFPIVLKGKPPFLAGFTIDITESKQAERTLTQSLREKETLLRELYHRTKNTLQVIGSMLMLQASEYQDNEELQQVVRSTEERIQAISLVHQMLYRSRDLSNISIGEYIRELCSMTFDSYGVLAPQIELELDIVEENFLFDMAIPTGLVLNELLTNSLKYAFPDGRPGRISISLKKDDSGTLNLRYSDNGVGVPEGFDFRRQNSLGLKMIYNLGEKQLQGRVELSSDGGVSCSIEFRSDLYSARV